MFINFKTLYIYFAIKWILKQTALNLVYTLNILLLIS